MTELAKYDEPQPSGSLSIALDGAAISALGKFSDIVCKAGTCPEALRGKPNDVFLTIMTGLDFGFKPTQAFNLVYIVKGRASLSAEGMRSLLFQLGHDFVVVESSATKCVVQGRRKGSDVWHEASFTREQAKQAKLNGANWDGYPEDMLFARATTRLCKRFFPDVTNGLPSSEELYDEQRHAQQRPTLAAVAADRDKTAEQPATDPAALRDEVLAIEAEVAEAQPSQPYASLEDAYEADRQAAAAEAS